MLWFVSARVLLVSDMMNTYLEELKGGSRVALHRENAESIGI